MKRVAAWIVVLLVAGVGLAQAREAAPTGAYKIFAQDAQGRISLVDAMVNEAGEVVATSGSDVVSPPPGTLCVGGSCETPRGSVLTCPSTAGPICAAGEVCHCQCTKTSNGTYTAVNSCSKP